MVSGSNRPPNDTVVLLIFPLCALPPNKAQKNSFDHPLRQAQGRLLRWFDKLTTGFAQGRLSDSRQSRRIGTALPIFHQPAKAVPVLRNPPPVQSSPERQDDSAARRPVSEAGESLCVPEPRGPGMHDRRIVFLPSTSVKWPHRPDGDVIRPNDQLMLRYSAHPPDAF